MIRQVPTVLVITSILLSSAPNAFSQNPDHKGKVTVALRTIKALTQTGSPDPAHDKDCKAKFGNLIGQRVTTTYNINTKTLIMSATSTFQGKDYALNPLGIAGRYAFGVFKPKSDLPLYAVLFQISTQFNNPSSDLNLNLNEQTSCLVSSNLKGPGNWGGSVPMTGPAK